MASLYDLELQESNNFIHALADKGKTPALKLILDQKEQAATMGEVGQMLLAQFEDENSEMGKSLKRFQLLENDIQGAMSQVGMIPELATQANVIFSRSPESMENLQEEEKSTIIDYWMKKKSIISILSQKGYTPEELFA